MSKEILENAINPALNELTTYRIPVTDRARVMLIAIGLQESRLIHRFQIPQPQALNRKGPARGLWQFEAGGGVAGVMTHQSTTNAATAFARRFVGSTNNFAIWATLEYEDVLAAIFGRLLLWSDPRALPEPTLANAEAAWSYYIRNWRPGKPHRHTWDGFWRQALETVN